MHSPPWPFFAAYCAGSDNVNCPQKKAANTLRETFAAKYGVNLLHDYNVLEPFGFRNAATGIVNVERA